MEKTEGQPIICVVCRHQTTKCKFSFVLNGAVQKICSRECLTSFRECPDTYLVSETDLVQCELCGQHIKQDISMIWHSLNFCGNKCANSYKRNCTAAQCFLCGKTTENSQDLLILSFRAGELNSDRIFCRLCSENCLESFSSQEMNCRNCLQNIMFNEEDIFADIMEESESLSYFCSFACLENTRSLLGTHRKLERSLDVVVKRKADCSICGKYNFPHHEVNVQDKMHSLCSDECFEEFRCQNVSASVHMCDQCSTLCDTSGKSHSLSAHFGNRDHIFCDEQCLILFKATNRSFSYCFRCSSKRGKYGILYLDFGDSNIKLFCTPSCLIQHWFEKHEKMEDFLNVSCSCCHNLLTDPMYCQTNSIGTVQLFCSENCFQQSEGDQHCKKYIIDKSETLPKCINVNIEHECYITHQSQKRTHPLSTTDLDESSTSSLGNISEDVSSSSENHVEPVKRKHTNVSHIGVLCRPIAVDRGTMVLPITHTVDCQTDEIIDSQMRRVIPLPLPYLCPLPMAAYKLPNPVPHLLPVPVPVPIPLKLPSLQNVRDFNNAIKESVEKIPQDSFENAIINMSSILSDTDPLKDSFGRMKVVNELKMSRPILPRDIPNEVPHFELQNQPKIKYIDTVEEKKVLDDNWSFKFTYGVKAWDHWIANRQNDDKIMLIRRGDLINFTSKELSTLLTEFVDQVRKVNGEEYTQDSLYYLCLGVQAYLYVMKRTEDIFSGFGEFRIFTERLDSILSCWQPRANASGLLLCRVEEEHLWECKQLGSISAYVLLNTLVYYNAKYFLLKTPQEHFNLSPANVVKQHRRSSVRGNQDGKSSVLKYYGAKYPESACSYEQPENNANYMRCPVRLFEFYLMKCPESVRSRQDAFYLRPESCVLPDSPYWFSSEPLSVEEISKMLNRIFIVKEIQEAYITDQNSYERR